VWLRVLPKTEQTLELAPATMLALARSNPKPTLVPLSMGMSGGLSFLRGSDGAGCFLTDSSTPYLDWRRIDSIAYAFRSGEVWSVDLALLQLTPNYIAWGEIVTALQLSAARHLSYLRQLRVVGPCRWQAGLVGVQGRHLLLPGGGGFVFGGGPVCASDEVGAEGDLPDDQAATASLRPLTERLLEECGIDSANYPEL
jgi:hypothetical protein